MQHCFVTVIIIINNNYCEKFHPTKKREMMPDKKIKLALMRASRRKGGAGVTCAAEISN